MEQTPKIKMIKQDALVKIEIGTGFLQKLQHLLLHITNNVTVEQIEEYKKIVQEQKEFTEDWMHSLSTVSILLREIEVKAEEQGYTYDVDNLPTQEEN